MRLLLTGGHSLYIKKSTIERFVANLPLDTVVVHTGEPGVDRMVERAAQKRHVPTEFHLPLSQTASYMAQHAWYAAVLDDVDAVAVFWDGSSGRSRELIKQARARGIPLAVLDHDGCERPEPLAGD